MKELSLTLTVIKHVSLSSSFVFNIKDLLFPSKATISNFELWLVEGLWLVEVVPIGCAVHVTVQVLLCSPASAVPELTVGFVTAGVGV